MSTIQVLATQVPPPFMSQANAVGQGFNVYGPLSLDSLITPLFDFQAAGEQVFTFLGVQYSIPKIVTGIESTDSYYTGGTYETRDSFQNSISTHANVDASYGAFSGELSAAFSAESQQSASYTFSYRNFFAQLAYLELIPDEQFLTQTFQARLAQLPLSFTPEALPVFEDFFNTFGVYYTNRIVLGANLDFWVATAKSSELTDVEISACLKAQYDAMFTSGKLSIDMQGKAEWTSYSQDSRVGIQAIGSDPTKGAALAALDPFSPSPASVQAYVDWVSSVKTDPAIVDFQLTGIWELCGGRRKAVQEAWDAYGTMMRPHLVVATATSLDPPSDPVRPAISIGQVIPPPPLPQDQVGYRMVVLKGNDITAPGAVAFDRYYSIPAVGWSTRYEAMYDEMAADILAQHLTAQGCILVLAGFNLNWNAVPTPRFVDVLRAAGAGDGLTDWLTTSDPGSGIGFAANIVVVGIFGLGIGSAVELMVSYSSSDVFPVTLNALFYRKTDGSGYSIGLGDVA